MSLGKIDLKLDSRKLEYAPGDAVSGHVELVITDGKLEVTSISVQLAGKAFCIWSEGRNAYFASQRLHSKIQYIYGQGANSGNRTEPFAPGSHRISFTLQLPNPLVSSYKDDVGYVKHKVKVIVIRPWHSMVKVKKEINVRQILDLNQLQGVTAPSGGTDETTVCCGCLSGAIEGEVRTDKTGYVPGDWVVANATLKNNSSSKVKKTTLGIARRVTYITPLRRRKTPWTIAHHTGPPCPPGKTINLNNIKVQVPDTVPTNTNLRIMKFEYAVLLQGHLRTCTFDARTFAPIIIGSAAVPRDEADTIGQTDVFAHASTADGHEQGVTNAGYDWSLPGSSYK